MTLEWKSAKYGLVLAPILGGVEAIANEPMVVNGVTIPLSEQLVCIDGNATAKTLTCRVTGKTFVEGGSGTSPTFGVSGPGRPGELVGIKGEGGKRLLAPDNDWGALATEDEILEIAMVTRAGTNVRLFDKRGSATNTGRTLYRTVAGDVQYYLNDGVGYVTVNTPALADGTLVLLHGFMDMSGSGVWYTNGAAHTPVVLSGLGSMAKAVPFTLFAISGGGSESTHTLFYLGRYKGAGILNSHLQPTLVAHRFSIFSHYIAAHSHASLVPTLPTRTSAGFEEGF